MWKTRSSKSSNETKQSTKKVGTKINSSSYSRKGQKIANQVNEWISDIEENYDNWEASDLEDAISDIVQHAYHTISRNDDWSVNEYLVDIAEDSIYTLREGLDFSDSDEMPSKDYVIKTIKGNVEELLSDIDDEI